MKPTLLLFTDHFPFGVSEPFLADELPYLAETFHQITIVPLDSSGDSVQRVVPGNVTIFHPDIKNYKSKKILLLHGFFGKGNLGSIFTDLLCSGAWRNHKKLVHWFTVALMIRSYLPLFFRLMKQVQDPEQTVVYFYWGQRWSQLLPFMHQPFKKVVIRFHGSDLYENLYQGYIPFRKRQLELADGIFTISDTGRRYLKERYPEVAEKIQLARLGSSDHGRNPDKKKDQPHYVIVSCAGLIRVKRVPLIPEILNQTTLPIHWYHFGDGPQMQELRSKSAEPPKHIVCHLMGHVDHDALLRFYQTVPVDLFLNVSYSEGVPVSIMEALSFGIPVMATDVGGTGELVNDTNGQLIPRDFSPVETARLLDSMLRRADLPGMRLESRKTWEERANSVIVYPGFIEKFKTYIATSSNGK